MGWCHPDVSLEDLLLLIKGFVDILVLASGYQSSGRPATWDADNIEKAVKWGIFFEQVFKTLRDSVNYEESVKELDAALHDLTSSSLVPHGLAHLSSAILSRARELILQRLLQTCPLRDAHLIEILRTIIKMDIDYLDIEYSSGIEAYISRLMLQMESLKLTSGKSTGNNPITFSTTMDLRSHGRSRASASNIEAKESAGVHTSCFIIQELLKRQDSVTCISSLESGLSSLHKMFTKSCSVESENNLPEGPPSRPGNISKRNVELAELIHWDRWRSVCLGYMLDNRTIRLLSGANLIFNAPKVQWVRVFEQLIVSTDVHNDNLLETMEILLLGLISSRWNTLIEHVMSYSCNNLSILKQFSYVRDLLQESSRDPSPEKKQINFKEKGILEYLTPLFQNQPQKLWQLPPVLVAAAIPSWSILFMMYLGEIERQLSGASSSIRFCDCSEAGNEHRDCEVAERIWCLYALHIQKFSSG